jgi:hypothetical protein
MARKKPVVLLVVGIVHVVFSAINLLSLVLTGVIGIFLFFLIRGALQNAGPREQQLLDEIGTILSNNFPALVPTIIAWTLITFATTVMQLFGGIGCIRVKPLGRWTLVLWAVLSLLELVASFWYSAAVLQPGLEKAMPEIDKVLEKSQQNQGRPGNPPPPKLAAMFGPGGSTLNMVAMLAGSAFQFGLAAMTLVFLLLPATGRNMALYNAPVDESEMLKRDQEDYYDDDYARQRRLPADSSPGNPPPPP